MASRKQEKERLREERVRQEAAAVAREQRARRLKRGVGVVVVAAVAGLGAIFAVSAGGDGGGGGQADATAGGGSGKYPYAVGNPGPGRPAPTLRLPSTQGGTFDLAKQRGKTTLLYFQEGLMCQPCWDQIKDLERDPSQLEALGIDQMVSITGNDLDDLRTKASDEGLKTPVLADPGLQQSAVWEANKYGMMGDSANGHSFVVVGPDGTIQHRADYGGAPKYTMYVPVSTLVADLREGLEERDAA
jgi:peroxiredoxin